MMYAVKWGDVVLHSNKTNNRYNPDSGLYLLFVCFGVVRSAQQIVNRYMVVIRNFTQGGGRDVNIAALIVAVNTLAAG